jgi:hypothetical protein
MEATKYMKAFENFDEDSVKAVKSEETPLAGIKKIWDVIDSGDFFCVISAYTDGTDPDTQKEQHEKLKNDVLKLKYAYLEQSFGYCYSDGKGQTTVSRKSLVVALMQYQELLALGKKYNQEIIAFGGNGGMSVVRVSDEAVLLDMNTESMKLAWTGFICNPHNIPWQ